MRALTTLSLVLVLSGCTRPAAEPQAPETAQAESVVHQDPEVAEAEPAEPAEAEPAELTEDEPAEVEQPADTSGLRWQISAHPARLTMAQRARFRLRRSVTNRAREARDAMRSTAEFTLNGESSMALNMAFGNGARESVWAELPPGRTVFDEREMGESLFPAPGTYVIEMTVDGETSSVEVVVRP